MTWPRAALADCCAIVSGATPRTGVAEYWDGEIEWATPADLSKLSTLTISSTGRRITRAGLASCAATVLPVGSVLFSSRAPIGHVAINTVPMATNQGFKSLVPKPDRVDAGYLAYWLRTNKDYLQSLGSGATFKEVSKAVVARVEIPLPPLDEQRRIAAILDQTDALRAKRRQSLALLDDLTQSVYHDMFGDPAEAVVTVKFREIASLAGGRNLVADDSKAESVFRVLKISAVTTGQFKPEESKPLPPEYVPPESHLVHAGDLLMSRANTAELVGAVAYVEETPPNLALPDKIWRFVWRDKHSVPVFYQAVLQTPTVRQRIGRMSSGTGGSMKNISQAKLETLELPRVDAALQHAFAARVQQINAQRAAVQRSLATLDELFASLQSRAFSGQL